MNKMRMTGPEKAIRYITASEGAKLTGKSVGKFARQMQRHGVRKTKGGQYNAEKALGAAALGAALDKRNTEKQVAEMESRGVDPGNIVYQAKKAQLRKIILQGDILQTECDNLRGKLGDRRELADFWVNIYADMVTALNTWREGEIAKHPQHREYVEGIAGRLQDLMNDVIKTHADG